MMAVGDGRPLWVVTAAAGSRTSEAAHSDTTVIADSILYAATDWSHSGGDSQLRGGGREVAAYQDTADLGFLEAPRVDKAEWSDTSDGQSASDVIAERRDVSADERDREAEVRDRVADERDHQAEGERHVLNEVVDLRERRSLARLRQQAAAERQQAASDRAAAATDRKWAAQDREMAACERGDGDDLRRPLSRSDETSAVIAHSLLNSSAVVSMGLTTLEAHWDGLLGPDRLHLLQRMFCHASTI